MKIRMCFVLAITMLAVGCKKNEGVGAVGAGPVTAGEIRTFLSKYPQFAPYGPDINALYEKRGSEYVWYDGDGRNDFADVLYNRASQIEREGVVKPLPYEQKIGTIFSSDSRPKPESDLLISAMYFFYAKQVYEGVNPSVSRKLGWFLPRERTSFVSYLDTLMADPDLLKKDESENIGQYYNLRKALQKYRAVQQAGGWQVISLPEKAVIKKGDDSPVVAQVRKRLATTSEFGGDSLSTIYDDALVKAVSEWRRRQNLNENSLIDSDLVDALNIPVETRIKTIIVNMERCRWVTPDYADSKEFISVNIPSYHLSYVRDRKTALESNVVVGEDLNKTVIFSGKISYLVFSPYWNIPKSIAEKEIKPEIAKDRNYLKKHHMEVHNGNYRQKPGPDNSLGLVKFMFPNSNNIYLHDTPAKGLFSKDARALSHGCVRVEKARDLAVMILDDEPGWDEKKVDEAMHSGVETKRPLKRKIPVYIAYFTAWADVDGNVSFYPDIYKRDDRLAAMLYKM